jgi:3-hydroxybutyryl-CoA dehydrogenase
MANKRRTDVLPGPVGLVGLGLMGQGIATCLLAHGFRVLAYNRTASRARASRAHIGRSLEEMVRRRLTTQARVRDWRDRYELAPALDGLAPCALIIETVKEDLELKREIYAALEQVLPETAIITSNTSSLPISLLQEGRLRPERFIGMHWGEPVQVMRYLEITPGRQTSPETVEIARRFGQACGKEPTVLYRDIRGFLSNRMMYAMLREAFYLVEQGVASLEDVDRSFRNDIGWWATIAGPFRWMDLTGIPAYMAVMEGLLPELNNSTEVPRLMKEVVGRGALGIANQNGFYPYTKAAAKKWEQAWIDFTYDIRKLVEKYERRVKL